MILAAYLVTGFIVASVYAVGMLRGRRDRIHRLGLLIPLTVACIATPIQFAVGDTAARAIAKDQPIKFAGMECVQKTSTDVTEYIYGRCTSSGVKGGIGIPGFDSFLVGWSTSTQVTGLDSVPADDRPPANTMLHWAFDTMVGICTMLIALGLWLAVRLVAQARLPADALVPARDGGLRRGRRRGARVRLDRDRGRTPAVGRLQRHAHQGRGHQRERGLGHVRRDPGALRRAGRGVDHHAAGDGAALARGGRAATTTCPTAPAAGRPPASRRAGDEQRRRGRDRPVDRRDDVRRLRRRRLRGRAVEPALRRGRTRPAAPRADRLGDRTRVGGQPRVADLRARRALDGLLVAPSRRSSRRCSSRSAWLRSASSCAGPGSRSTRPRGAPADGRCPSSSSGSRRC